MSLLSIFFGSLNGLEDMFEHFHGDMQRQMEAIQKEMEDIMRGFGAVDFSSGYCIFVFAFSNIKERSELTLLFLYMLFS